MVTSTQFYGLMLATIVTNTLIVGPIIVYIVRRENESLGYRHVALEWQDPEIELRMLACVHNPRHVSTIVGLIAALRGSERGPITPYLMHLIELPDQKSKDNSLMYHQREDDELSDEDNYGGNEVVEINEAVDAFTAETGVVVHQVMDTYYCSSITSPFLIASPLFHFDSFQNNIGRFLNVEIEI